VKSGAAGLMLKALRSRAVRRSYFALGEAFFDKSLLDGEFQELFIEPFIKSPEYARRLLRVVEAFDAEAMDRLAETHAQIRCPSLLIWGADDPFFPTEKARAMLPQFAGGARLVEIPRAKLLVHEERPEAFAEHALPFLRDALR
jgi:haloalkane dehalogenase